MSQPLVQDLSGRLPPGHSLHRGRTLDLPTLTAIRPVATPGDPTCCPPYRVAFRLRLDGDTLP